MSLTLRQEQAMDYISRGLTYKEAALEMGVSTSTYRTHVYWAFRALGVTDRGSAIRAYMRLKAPAAAEYLHATQGRISRASWESVVALVLDALEQA